MGQSVELRLGFSRQSDAEDNPTRPLLRLVSPGTAVGADSFYGVPNRFYRALMDDLGALKRDHLMIFAIAKISDFCWRIYS